MNRVSIRNILLLISDRIKINTGNREEILDQPGTEGANELIYLPYQLANLSGKRTLLLSVSRKLESAAFAGNASFKGNVAFQRNATFLSTYGASWSAETLLT
jgi:hypothetical protein